MQTIEVRPLGHGKRIWAFSVLSAILLAIAASAHLAQIPPLHEGWSAGLAGLAISLMFVVVASFGHTPERLLEIGDDGVKALSGAHFDQDTLFPWAELVSVSTEGETRLKLQLKSGKFFAGRENRLFGESPELLAENQVVIHFGKTSPTLAEVVALCSLARAHPFQATDQSVYPQSDTP